MTETHQLGGNLILYHREPGFAGAAKHQIRAVTGDGSKRYSTEPHRAVTSPKAAFSCTTKKKAKFSVFDTL